MSKGSRRRAGPRTRQNPPRPILRRQVPAKAPARIGWQRWPIVVAVVVAIGIAVVVAIGIAVVVAIGIAVVVAIGIAVVVAIGIAVVGVVLLSNRPSGGVVVPSGPVGTLTDLQTGSPPWPPDNSSLRARLESDGLQVLTAEGQVQHTHQHLDLFADGQPIQVPADVGIDRVNLILSPIHTHDATGIIHVESPIVRKFTLGEYFDVWGVRFDAHCIGGLCEGTGRVLAVFLNGKPVAGDPRSVVLNAQDEIVVAVGTLALLPSSIPSSYAFPAGL